MELKISHISKSFDDTDKETLQDIDLEIKEGEFICLVGPSGCGKSTLLNLVAGLEMPSKGEIILDGKKIEGPGADRGVMFQEAALFPWLKVIDNIKIGLQFIGVGKEEQEQRAEHYLKMVQLYDFKDYAVHQLSGGMKQRVALARSLAMDSKVLLMDEPFSALDKQTTNLLRKEVENIWMKTKKTIIFVTHSVEEAVYFADRIVVLSDHPGRIKEIYKVELPRPRHIESPEFINIRKMILEQVKKEAEKIAEAEFDKG